MLQTSLLKILMDSRIKLTVILIVLLLLAYQLSITFWRFVPEPELSGNGAAASQIQVGRVEKNQKSYLAQAEAIGRTHLFGKAVVDAAPVQVVEEAPETKLNYKLRGVYFSDEASLSSAIVEIQPNKSQHFRIDDELAEKITVSDIFRDHILIDRYGKIERLNLQKPAVSKVASSRAAASGIQTSSVATTRLLQNYKKRYVSNPLALAKRFQAIPVQENGRNIGFRLKALRGESLLKKLNFNENDVFTKINGISLDKPFQALDALKSLTTANSVSVTIMRNGSEQTMDFAL